jgi:hypothetical protein
LRQSIDKHGRKKSNQVAIVFRHEISVTWTKMEVERNSQFRNKNNRVFLMDWFHSILHSFSILLNISDKIDTNLCPRVYILVTK